MIPGGISGRQPVAVLAVLLLAGLLVGCSINPPLQLADFVPARASLQLASVPFYPQDEYQCGPAALAGVLGAAGVFASPAELAPQVYLPGRQGSLQLELLAATRRAGRIPYPVANSAESLFTQLRADRPVLILQNLQTRQLPAWHYAVLVGFDAPDNRVYLNSGRQQGLVMDAPEFMRTWDWAGRWGMVVLRPGELPAPADVADYMQAVADFEKVAGSAAAAPAWEVALSSWPGQPTPYLALGNRAHAEGDLLLALDYFRRGLLVAGDNPALGNNMASVLGEVGCPQQGLALLDPILAGLAADSRWRPVINATRGELAQLPASRDAGFCGQQLPRPG